jgi:hypothetical protein
MKNTDITPIICNYSECAGGRRRKREKMRTWEGRIFIMIMRLIVECLIKCKQHEVERKTLLTFAALEL